MATWSIGTTQRSSQEAQPRQLLSFSGQEGTRSVKYLNHGMRWAPRQGHKGSGAEGRETVRATVGRRQTSKRKRDDFWVSKDGVEVLRERNLRF